MPNTSNAVILTVLQGEFPQREYRFEERDCLMIGRMDDCGLRIPDDGKHDRVSRHHCQIDINPPQAAVCDFGSLHGTYVNDELIGKRRDDETPEQGRAAYRRYSERMLKDGDIIRLANSVVLQVKIIAAVAPTVGDLPLPRSGDNISEVFRTQRAAQSEDSIIRDVLKDYDILKDLPKGGGGGKVVLVRSHADGKPYAFKIMIPVNLYDRQSRAKFEREVDIYQQLKNPHIVPLLEVIDREDFYFLKMEYCAGGDVHQWMSRIGRVLTPREAVGITLQVLEALIYAHRASVSAKIKDGTRMNAVGVVHRDIKPMNIVLLEASSDAPYGAPAVAKLADFGLAKAFDLAGLSGLSRTGIGRNFAAGTFQFMSRVQCVKFKYTEPDVDVWATAASLYYMLTSHTPRDFPKNMDPYEVIMTQAPVPIRERKADIPQALARVIDTALIDKPEMAIKTPRELFNELKRLAL